MLSVLPFLRLLVSLTPSRAQFAVRAASMQVNREEDDSSSYPFLIRDFKLFQEVPMLMTLVCTQVFVLGCLSQGLFADSVIGQTFATSSSSENTWGPAAYGLTAGTFMLPAGRLGDMYGHRRCYIAAWTWLAVASLLAGVSVFSNSFIFYAVCRGLQGMGTSMLLPSSLAILGSVYKDGPRKNLAFSLFAAGAPTGFTVWGIISGLITESLWWPWIFWVTAIACCTLACAGFLTIPHLPGEVYRATICQQQDTPVDKSPRRDFDWAGTATGVLGLVLFNVAWNQAPSVGWAAPSSLGTLITGFLLLLAFPFVEKRASRPLIPVDRLSKDSIFVLATMSLAWSSFGILVFYLVNFLTRLRGESILITGVQFIPVPIAGFAASYLNAFLLARRVPSADVLAFSCIWFIVGNLLLATMPVHQSFWYQVFWVNVLAPFGIDLSFPASTLLMSQLVPPEQQGIAASLIATVVYYSQSIGLGIAGTVQSQVSNGSILRGYRGAFFTGVGMSGFAFLVSMWPVMKIHVLKKGL